MLKSIRSLNTLRTFEVCARVNSIQETARMLHVTPSAVSHQLKKLESELGFNLFVRSHRKITLTKEGKALHEVLQESFLNISNTVEELRNNGDLGLSINVLPVFSIRWLNPRLMHFFGRYPDIDLTIKNSYRLADLSEKECDLAIRWGDGDWPGVTSEKLFDEYAVPAVSPKLVAGNELKTNNDLLNLPLIKSFDGDKHWKLWAKKNKQPIHLAKKYLKFNDPSAALQAAIDGLGVVLAPISLVHEAIQAGTLLTPVPKLFHTNKAYYLVTPIEEKTQRQEVIAFKDWLREEANSFSSLMNETYDLG